MAEVTPKCPRCGRELRRDGDALWCIDHGEVTPFPAEPIPDKPNAGRKRTCRVVPNRTEKLPAEPPAPETPALSRYMASKKRSEFFSDHESEIFNDLEAIGQKKTEKKWNFPHRSMGQFLLYRHPGPVVPTANETPRAPGSRLPTFPEFKDSWSVITQEKWLEVYLALATVNKQEEVKSVKDSKAGG